MDRNTVIGFILIGLVLMVWMMMNAPPPQQQIHQQDSTGHHAVPGDTMRTNVSQPETQHEEKDSLGKYFSHLAGGKEKLLRVETGLFKTVLSSKGGSIASWELKKFTSWSGYPLELVNPDVGKDFNLLFLSTDGKLINTRSLDFQIEGSQQKAVDLLEGDSARIDFVLPIDNGSRITKSYTFYKDRYYFDVQYKLDHMENIISNFEYQVTWETGLRYQERNSIDESNSAEAYAYAGGELTELDAAKINDPPVKQNISGRVSWVATRNKYFGIGIICRDPESQGAYLEGVKIRKPDNGAQEYYSIGLKMPFLGKIVEISHYTVYLGPLDFNVIKSLNVDLEKIMSLGAAWIIRPIAEYIMIPLFQAVHIFIPNYGLVIIVFSLIIKVALHPLTRTSLKSMRKMQALQPMMDEVREKYKDDPQKMNQQIMRLYGEYGVNPASGCLPFLLQMPILYALWATFRSAIELRHASFFGWIKDLSIPDVIARLPFPLPLFNITELSGLSLLMGITMFVQQKMSVKDPRQKTMIWLMPLMMTLLFNSFPSGLNLYYLVFNLLSIGQQYWVNKHYKDEPLKKVERKKPGGIFSRIAKDLPKMK